MQNVPKCIQIHNLACSYIRLHAVTWACMKSFLRLSSSQEFRSACLRLSKHKEQLVLKHIDKNIKMDKWLIIDWQSRSLKLQPVKRIVKEGKYGEESIRIEIIVIVPDHVQKRKKYVNCVKDVESDQKKIETNLVLKSRHSSVFVC